MLTLHPEGRPAMKKAERYIASYRVLRREMEGSGMRLGILVQSILGHWPRVDRDIEDWTRTVNVKGEKVRFCPDDPGFAKYIEDVFALVAAEHPAFVMLDDDVRAYSHEAECFCLRHVAEFNERRGTHYSERELREKVSAAKQDDPDYTTFFAVQRDMMERLVRRIRAALDATDPSIPAGVCVAGEETFLDESDTCPHNLWSKSALSFFTHMEVAAFLGYRGAKVWFVNGTKMGSGPVSRSYTDILARNRGVLDALADVAGAASCMGGVALPCFTRFPTWGSGHTRARPISRRRRQVRSRGATRLAEGGLRSISGRTENGLPSTWISLSAKPRPFALPRGPEASCYECLYLAGAVLTALRNTLMKWPALQNPQVAAISPTVTSPSDSMRLDLAIRRRRSSPWIERPSSAEDRFSPTAMQYVAGGNFSFLGQKVSVT